MTRARIRKLAADCRGVALVEFAIVLPVMLLLFLGGYQLSDAIACKRKVTIMARAVGDITSQYRALTVADLDTLMTASTQILAPYATAPAQIRVTQITVDGRARNYRVNWSRGRGTTATATGKYPVAQLPAAYRQPGMVFIRTEVTYTYRAPVAGYVGAIPFTEDMWLLPRRSPTITLS